MSLGNNRITDPDDYFTETRMSFGDHLEELRMHLWKAIAGFLVGLVVGFFVGQPLLRFISKPVEAELRKYWDKYYENKQQQMVRKIRHNELDNGRPFVTTVRLDRQALQQQLGLKNEDKKLPVDVLPLVTQIMRELEIDDWIDPKLASSSRWIDVPAEISNSRELAMEMKRYETSIRSPVLSALSVQESFMVYCKVSIVAGFVIASPWIFYQIWAFIAAGLYPHEKRYVNVFLPVSIGLFLGGVAVCQFLVIPKAIEALLWFNEWLEIEPDFRLNEWLGFAIMMPVVFGLSFQTPLVMLFCERIGVLTVEAYRSKRRIAWFLMAVFAAVITPSVDVFSMLFLWVPMCLLYELGIGMCVMSPRQPTFDIDVPDSEELIEV
ncbi:MAG TPA: twin-arginine translocase subunit TatC [Gemmataceae bacterium]|nr:twin-arginine translocase subunit TatC [Gemmataceae bacterium]